MMTMSSFASTDATLFTDNGSLYRTSSDSIMKLDLQSGTLEITYKNGSAYSAVLPISHGSSRNAAMSFPDLPLWSARESRFDTQIGLTRDGETISGACSGSIATVAAAAATVEAACSQRTSLCGQTTELFDQAISDYRDCTGAVHAGE
jgi:hypothetical protein